MAQPGDNSAAPTPPVQSSVEQLTAAVEETIGLLRHGGFRDVPALTVRMQALVAELAAWRGEFAAGPGPSQTAASCVELRRRALVLSEVLRHISGVAAGLGAVRAAATGAGYGRDGRSTSPRTRRLNTEV
jgi:hypothetical protein